MHPSKWRYIFPNGKGGYNITMHMRGSTVDFFRILLKYAQVRHPSLTLAKFFEYAMTFFVNSLSEEDKAVFDSIAKDYYIEQYGTSPSTKKPSEVKI